MQVTSSLFLRRASVILLPLIALLASPAFCAAPTIGQDNQVAQSAIAAVKPALVRIFVAEVDYDQGREIKYEASGSGVIISKDGYVVTNHHVAGWAKRIFCTLSNREQVDADLIGSDPLTDIAVIKLRSPKNTEFPFAKWGDSSKLKVGDVVMAMGSPRSLSQSVTMGIVSNAEMIMPDFMRGGMTLDGEDVGSMVRWIGHDATIQPGNSGGPLVNIKGQVVGINEIGIGSMAGAIPSKIAEKVADELIKFGKIKRSWLGISVQPLLKGSGMTRGALIGGVIPGSPAATAGFKAGDIFIRLAGNDISGRFAEEMPLFNQMVAALPIGKVAEAIILRDGKEMTLKVTPQERPEARPKPREFKQWGMVASNISYITARTMKRPNQDGAMIESVRPGGPCGEAKPSINEGDIIVDVAGKPVKSIEDLVKITEEITKGKTEPVPVLVTFDRDTEQLVTVIKVGIKEMPDPGLEIKKAYLPIGMQVITRDIADSMGIKGRTGVRVTQVYPNSAAEQAGLKVGDLIVALDGQNIPASQQEDTEVLPAMIRQYKTGTTADLTVMRGKDEMKISVVLPESPPLPREMKKYKDETFEFTARDLASRDRIKDNIDQDVTGVYIEEVSQGGWAALGRLETGMIISEVDGKPIHNIVQLRETMENIAKQKPEYVILRVQQGVQESFVELETDWANGK